MFFLNIGIKLWGLKRAHVASIIYPTTPVRGILTLKIWQVFSKKSTPHSVIIFVKMGFKKFVQLMNIWISLLYIQKD